MTDYFALLDQPRRPWLDAEKLKQAFHERTLRAHPDAQTQDASAPAEGAFAELNQAYQTLQNPKRRLHHLLTLEGHPPRAGAAPMPQQAEELFPVVAAVTQEAERAEEQAALASNALSRSLLKPRLLEARTRVNEVLLRLADLEAQAETELRQLSDSWEDGGDLRLEALHGLYLRFSYLTRWIAQLEEKRTRLAIQ